MTQIDRNISWNQRSCVLLKVKKVVEEGLDGDGLKTQTEGYSPSIVRKNVVDRWGLMVVISNYFWTLV